MHLVTEVSLNTCNVFGKNAFDHLSNVHLLNFNLKQYQEIIKYIFIYRVDLLKGLKGLALYTFEFFDLICFRTILSLAVMQSSHFQFLT